MFAVLACARGVVVAPSDTPAAGVDGCYTLRPGTWELDAILTRTLSVNWIPRALRLTGDRLPGWDMLQSDTLRLYTVETGPSLATSASIFTYWRALRVGSDSIYIGAPLPMAGASLRLGPAPNGLAGTLTAFTDAIPPDGIASVTVPAALDRIPCR